MNELWDNREVIKVNQDGIATITAITTKASSNILVKVLSYISDIVSTVTQSHLYVGQTEPISVSVEPNNCVDSSYEWKSSDKDKSVAIVDKLDDGQTIIRATGIGNCTLTCVAKEGGCLTTCNVLVESTLKKRECAWNTQFNSNFGCCVYFLCYIITSVLRASSYCNRCLWSIGHCPK